MSILNQPTPQAFREGVKVGKQNLYHLYQRAKELVGDRDPREHEFSIQSRAMDADKRCGGLGLPVLLALCGSLFGKNSETAGIGFALDWLLSHTAISRGSNLLIHVF